MKVLHIAEMCNPDWVSVPLVSWSHSHALASLVDVHLVTHHRNTENIARAGLREGIDFTAIDSDRVGGPLNKVAAALRGDVYTGQTIQTAFDTVTYYWFEHLVWQRLGARIRAHEFDVVHRLAPVSPVTPSTLATRCHEAGVPFVLGPINGGVPWPKGFDSVRHQEKEWLSYVREGYKLLPGYRATRDDSAAIVVASKTTWEQIGPRWRDKVVYLPENAIDPSRFTARTVGPVTAPLKVVFVGRLVLIKAVDMLIDACAELVRSGQVVVNIVGDGPEAPALKARVAELKLEAGITFSGWVDHHQIQHHLADAHVFGFPSMREFGGGVVIEAMAVGLVPLVLDYGGPGELVSPTTGFAVPMAPRPQLVAGLRERLQYLVDHPEVIRPMGERARNRVTSQFTWPARARQTLEIYRWVTGQRDKPDFGMPLAD